MEAILKLLALGPLTYARDPWNDFDFIIVFISIIELVMKMAEKASGGTALTVLRTLRLVCNDISTLHC